MADNTDDLIISISTDQATLRRSIQRIERDLAGLSGSVQKQFTAVGKSIDNSISSTMQNRINAMVGIGTKASKEWTGALADQGKELERLRAKYNPLFATITQYKAAVAEIKQAHAVGAISANEMALAISKERQAALASTAAIKGRNAALEATPAQRAAGGAGAFQTANIAAQFQDIAVQLQGGSKPLTIALQQGTQLASVFQTMGSGRQIIAGLGAAFASLVSPVSLVTIGLIAAGGAAYQYFSSVGEGGKKSEEALKKEDELIQRVADKWGSVLPELKKYADERQRLLDVKEQKDASLAEADKQWTELRKNIGLTQAKYAEFLQTFNDQAADTAKVGALQKAYKELSDGIANGTATTEQAKAVQAALLALMQETGIKAVGDFAKTFDVLATSIAGARSEADKLKSAPLFNENLSKSRLPTLGPLGPVYSDNGKLLTDPNEIERYKKQQEENRNPTIDTGRGLPVPVPTPTAKPIQLGEEPNKQAETAATKAANAYRDLVKIADDRIGQLQQEIDLLGKYGVDADAARFALDLFQRSEDKGRSLSEQQRKEIEKKVALYKQYSETLSKAKLQQDLLMDARYNSLSKQDQQITTTLRQYGLPEDLNSPEAGQIRKFLNIEDARSDLRSFFGDFKNALLNNGGDIGKAFADAIQNAALNQISKIADRLIDQLINGILGAGSGGGILGGVGTRSGAANANFVANTTLSQLIGANDNLGRAPVIPVTRAPLGNIAAYAAAIKSIESGGNYSAMGPVTASGDRAYGAYQVMGANVGPWTRQALGYSLSPSQYLASSSAQDAVFQKIFGGYAGRYGASGAAQAWFGGPGSVGSGGNAADMLGTTGTQYVEKFNSALTRLSGTTDSATGGLRNFNPAVGSATQNLGQFGNGLGQLGNTLQSGATAGGSSGGGGGLFGWLASLFGGVSSGGAASSVFNTRTYADGGHVSGPGGPTSDSIPAMLSNGEFVVNAASARRHRRLLDAINSGSIARFASGGLVGAAGGSRVAGRASAGASGVVVNITNNANAQVTQKSRQTSSGTQIDVLVDEMVADKVSTPGSRSRSAMQSQFGLRGGLARR
ncbi:tail length tape measure protein [Rhizobium bangladeshense]|uniref:phage tail length tape measure family protein n=1 Tax=Rhizobium bangladeshense TaxID=1138189 RepID=UPI001C831EA1|nr:phage tail length tape measure family protein [Rhizobium bangladeshense]MBX4906170.1 tail length tape measure protein [Rhizobium bangladeshense]